MAELRAENLVKTFDGGDHEVGALRGVSLTLPAGESLAICGSSGAGKTTLLHLLGGLDQPTSGRVFLGDTEISALSSAAEARFRNETLGFVFQFHHLLNDFTVAENIAMPLLIAGLDQKKSLAMAQEWLERVGLVDKRHSYPKELSGGQQQRAAIVRALVHRPKLVLADEPTGNLDEGNGRLAFDLLLELNRELKATLVVVTHNDTFATRLNKTLRLEAGRAVSLTANDTIT